MGEYNIMADTVSHGRDQFADRFNLQTKIRYQKAAEVIKRVEAEQLEVVRLSFADQHGILRARQFSQVIFCL